MSTVDNMRLILLLLVPLAAEGSILGAIMSVLSYYSTHREPEATPSLIFGVMLTRGQLSAIKLINNELKNDIDVVVQACDMFIRNNTQFHVTKEAVNRVEESFILLKSGKRRPLKAEVLPYKLEKNLIHGSPSPTNSTDCLLEVMMESKISTTCLMQMADTDARGYTISHQALYYTIASSLLPISFVHESMRRRCEVMLSEVMYAWENRMSEDLKLRDLVIEEVAVCGINKYLEFLTEPMLDFILSLQREEGCFSLAKEGPMNECHQHLSAVSILALTNFLYAQSEGRQYILR